MADCRYLINIPEDRIDAAVQALAQAGITLNPVTDMIAVPTEHILDGIFSGADLETLTRAADDHMERSQLPFRLARRIEALPAVTRMAILHCYTLHGEWSPDPEPSLKSMETRHLWDLQRNHPDAFQPHS